MSVPYYGDFPEDHANVIIPFNTFTSDDPSASVTIGELADTDIHFHKDGNVAQLTDDASVAVSIDFDGITGNHLCVIDTSVNAFFVTGSEYQVRMEGTTVDGATINAWIGAFSIERAGGTIALLIGIPTTAEFEARSIVSADYTIVADLGTVQTGDSYAIVNGDHGLVSIQDDVDEILTDTGTTLDTLVKDIPTTAELALRTLLAADYTIVADLGTVQSADNDTLLTAIDGYLDTEIGAIISLLDDARGEPGDEIPAVNPDMATKIDYLYKFMRNKIETTATRIHVYNDAGDNKDQSSIISDDASTFTRGEFAAGDV